MRSFYRDDFARGEQATHIADAEQRVPYLERLAEDGIGVNKMIDARQLEVLPSMDVYLRNRGFDQDAVPASVGELIRSAITAGYTHTKLVGHRMHGVFADKPAVNSPVGYEARFNDLLPKRGAPATCNCDLSKARTSIAIGYHTDRPAYDYRWVAAGEPVFCSGRQVPGGNRNATVGAAGAS